MLNMEQVSMPSLEQMDLLHTILRDRVVHCAEGQEHRLHSETSADQCVFLTGLLKEINATQCLEVGLAYGISALAICSWLRTRKGPTYYAIDPMQSYWKHIGTNNLKEAGYWDFVRFIPEYSDIGLTQLWREGTILDFAYIDSTKVFDILLVDTHIIGKMLKVGGLLVIDDVSFPGIRKLVRLLAQMPQWEIHAVHGLAPISPLRSLAAGLTSLIPRRRDLFSPDIADAGLERRINAQAVALRKVSNDDRTWNWSCTF
jgi:predicted O-methyltransferase YrrM